MHATESWAGPGNEARGFQDACQKKLKYVHACATFPICCAFFVDSKLEVVTPSIASMRESASQFQLFSGLDGALVDTTH